MPTINKALAILAALAFFLPFITISCNNKVLVQATGAKLAQCAVSTCSPNDFLGADFKAMAGRNIPKVDIPGKPTGLDDANFVLYAAIACLVAVLTLFFGGRGGELISGVASAAAIALLFVFRSKFGDSVGPHLNSPEMGAASALIQIQLQFAIGFWASVALSAASAILAFKGTAPQSSVTGGASGSVGGVAQQPPGRTSSSIGQQMSSCPSCGTGNPAGNKFCRSCGGSLAMPAPTPPPSETGAVSTPPGSACPSCGAAVVSGNKFCLSCGKPLAAPAPTVQPSETTAPAPQAAARAAAAAVAPVAQPLPAMAPPVSEPVPAATVVETPVVSPVASEEQKPVPDAQQSSSAPPESQQKVCVACGAALAPAQKFCLACGTPTSQTAKPAEAQAPPPIAEAAAFTPAASTEQFQAGPFQTPPRSGSKVWIIAVVLLAILGAAGWFTWNYFGRPDVTVTAIPQKIHVAAGGKTSLQASVSGSKDTDVTWSIQEGNKGGEISPLGTTVEGGQPRAVATYIAPQTGGTFHVVAASHANPNRTAKVEIVVGGAPEPDATATAPEPSPAAAAAVPIAGNPMAAKIVGTWRGPSSDMTTVIGADLAIAMTSEADPQKNLHGTCHFTDNSHLQVDFGNGDVRTWEIIGVDDKYLRVSSQSKDGASAMIFSKISG